MGHALGVTEFYVVYRERGSFVADRISECYLFTRADSCGPAYNLLQQFFRIRKRNIAALLMLQLIPSVMIPDSVTRDLPIAV